MKRVEDAPRLPIVHVRSHSRHRQAVITVMIFARVSMILPLQNGQTAGRVTFAANRESGMMLFPFSSRTNPERMRRLTGQDAVGDPHLGVHDTCWLLHDCAAVQE